MDGAGTNVGAWVCSDCGARWDAGGDCARCGEGPLLDLRHPTVREELLKDEQRRREKHSQRLLALSALIAVLAWCSLGFFSIEVVMFVIMMPGGLIAVAGIAVAAFVLSRILGSIFPLKPRFPYLSG